MVAELKTTSKQSRKRKGKSVEELFVPSEVTILHGSSDERAKTMLEHLLSRAPRTVGPGGLSMEILLLEGQTILHYQDMGGVERFKPVSSAGLKVAFNAEPTDSGWLGPEIVRWGQVKDGEFVAAAIPPKRHNLLVEFTSVEDQDTAPKAKVEVVELTVPLPGLLLFGIGARWYLWAYAEARFKPDCTLYYPPVPNIFADHCGICWGSNKAPSASPANIDKAWDLFLSSPFNDHIAGGRSQAYPNDVRVQLAALAANEVKKFPTRDLVKVGHRNAAQQIDSLIGKDRRGY